MSSTTRHLKLTADWLTTCILSVFTKEIMSHKSQFVFFGYTRDPIIDSFYSLL